MKKIVIINGPNLNLIGTREPEIYGKESLADYLQNLKEKYPDIDFVFYQSNIEGVLVNFIQECIGNTHGIILNAGAYSHTSLAIADVIGAIKIPVIEVH